MTLLRVDLIKIYRDFSRDPAFAGLKAGATQLVPGRGDAVNPRVIVVGEAPGRDEDWQGRPFVGAAGKILEELLSEIGLGAQDVWITNVVKYRPPANRKPTDAELAAARPYLRAELLAVGGWGCRDVLLLGGTALGVLGPGLAISRFHGHVLERGAWRFHCAYHPAVALYRREMMETLRDDFGAMARRIGLGVGAA